MKVENVTSNRATKAGKKAGTLAGLGASGAYIAANRKDIFVKTFENTNIQKTPKNLALIGAACAVTTAAITLGARIVGGLVGKIVDKHNAKKDAEALAFIENHTVDMTDEEKAALSQDILKNILK